MVAEIGNQQALNAVANARQSPRESQSGTPAGQTGKTLPVKQTNLPQGSSAPEVNLPDLEKVTAALNKFIQSKQRSLQFTQDVDSGRIVVKVINKETNEVVRQFPPEELLSISSTIRKSLEENINPEGGFLLEELG